MGRVARHSLTTPTGQLLVVWTVAIAFFAFGPVRYAEVPRPMTWAFVAVCITAFCVGAWLSRPRRNSVATVTLIVPARREVVVRATAILGLLGAGCIAFDKLVLSGLDYSEGVTAVRSARELAVLAGNATALPRSPLLYVGYVTFSFSIASYLLFLLKGETFRRSTAILAVLGLASPFAYTFVYGGRSPLFLVIAMAIAAAGVRVIGGSWPFPNKLGAVSLIGLIAVTLIYSSWIASERFASTSTDYATLQARFAETYGASIGPLPLSAPGPAASIPVPASGSQPSIGEQAVMHYVIDSYYVTHEIPMLDRTLNADTRMGPYLGAYQFYLIAAFVERVVPGVSIDAIMIPELRAANVYGWFSTAWGGMYLDFGIVGAILGVLICGWLAGHAYRRAMTASDDGARLLMCYASAGILASPILSIFTISISLPILVALATTAWLLHFSWPVRVRLRALRSP
jgi:hypothetical protein